MGSKNLRKSLIIPLFSIGIFLIIGCFYFRPNYRLARSGFVALKNGDFEKSINELSKYLAINPHENKTTLRCRIKLGLAYLNVNKLKESMQQFNKSRELAIKLNSGDLRQYCETVLSIHEIFIEGQSAYSKGDLTNSFRCFQNAAEKARQIESAPHELKILKTWCLGLLNKRDRQEFIEKSERALSIARNINHRSDIVTMLIYIGANHSIENRPYDALIYHLRGAQAAREYLDKKGLVTALANAASNYIVLGDYRSAFKTISEALELAKGIGIERISTDLLTKLGSAISLEAFVSGDPDDFGRALKCFEESLEISKLNNDTSSTIQSLLEIGETYIRLHDYERARAFIDASSRYAFKKSDRILEAQSWNDRGEIELFLGSEAKAKSSFEKALEIGGAAISTPLRLHSYFGLARCYEKQRLRELALDYYSKSLNCIKQIGSSIQNDIERAYYVQNKTGVYQSYADFYYKLFQEDQDGRYWRELFAVIESVKAGSFIEFMNRKGIVVAGGSPDIAEIQDNMLDDKTAILEYFLGEARSYLILLTKKAFRIYPLPPRESIADSISGFLQYCENPDANQSLGKNAGLRLFNELLAPAITEIPSSATHLVIIPDGILYRLPFEALVNDEAREYLIEKYSISYAPSVNALRILGHKQVSNYSGEVMAIGAPKYQRLKNPKSIPNTAAEIVQQSQIESGLRIPALPYSKEEVKEIAKIFKSDRHNIYLGKDAQERVIKNLSPSQYRIIHIACHAISDDCDPYKSAIIFSLPGKEGEDGFLQLSEMYDLDLDAELLVLSSCQTAKGQIITNEGTLGLPRVFFYVGASSVLSSLWDIEDKATAQFMKIFYGGLIAGQSKARAVQLAKSKMIKSEYSHPFYWATFVLNGAYSSSIY